MGRVFRTSDWFLLGLVGALIIVFVYVAVNGDAHLPGSVGFAILVAVPVAAAAALLAIFRLRPEIRAKIVVMLGASIATLYAGEAFLFRDPLELRGPHPIEGFDHRGYFEIVRDLRAEGTSAYPVLALARWLDSPPSVGGTAVIPLAGVPHATIVMCNEAGTYMTYESDRFGFNNPDGQWDIPAEVALVGDSFVEGWCVPRGDSFAALIRHAQPATLNVGYTGHGPLAELGTIREYVAPSRPAHVFWFFYEGNDLGSDLPREMESPILRRYLEPSFDQQLRQRSVPLGDEMRRKFDARLAAWEPPPPPSPLVSVVKLRSLRALTGSGMIRAAAAIHSAPNALEDLGRILAEAKRTVEEWGGSLHFVYLPDLPSVVGRRDPADHARVLALAAELGLPAIDLLPEFRNHPILLSLFPYEEGRHLVKTRGLHYSADGHRLVGNRILDVIQEHAH